MFAASRQKARQQDNLTNLNDLRENSVVPLLGPLPVLGALGFEMWPTRDFSERSQKVNDMGVVFSRRRTFTRA